jgi:hypothetical protein
MDKREYSRARCPHKLAPMSQALCGAVFNIAGRVRDLARFDLGIDTKLRGYDLVRLRVKDVVQGDQVLPRAKVLQQETASP